MAQRGRFEVKFVVDEDRAKAIAKYVRTYLRPTPFNRWRRVPGQPVVSLYMDSPDLFLYRQVCEGHKNRFKLRIRFYDDDWSHPAFLEIKRRINDVIAKQRAMVSRDAVESLLNGGWPSPSHWPDSRGLVGGPAKMGVYTGFWNLASCLRAQGMVYVSYLREAYDCPTDEQLRVTFDRVIHGTRYDGSGKLTLPRSGVAPRVGQPLYNMTPDAVVLEMKFDERAPKWMYESIRIFDLRRVSVSKYCMCMESVGLAEGRPVRPSQEQPLLLREDSLGL
jgi:hypothetical protein